MQQNSLVLIEKDVVASVIQRSTDAENEKVVWLDFIFGQIQR